MNLLFDLEALRNEKERESIETRKRIDKMLEMAAVALRAVYSAAGNGDEVCQKALVKLEQIWKSKN